MTLQLPGGTGNTRLASKRIYASVNAKQCPMTICIGYTGSENHLGFQLSAFPAAGWQPTKNLPRETLKQIVMKYSFHRLQKDYHIISRMQALGKRRALGIYEKCRGDQSESVEELSIRLVRYWRKRVPAVHYQCSNPTAPSRKAGDKVCRPYIVRLYVVVWGAKWGFACCRTGIGVNLDQQNRVADKPLRLVGFAEFAYLT